MIELQNLSKKYGKRKAADGISVCLEKKTYGLLGPNGSGKTTLLRMVAGVIRPTGGRVACSSGRIGYLPQNFGCFPELRVREQLEYFACLKRIPSGEQKREISRVLGLVHLQERGEERCRKLSGGMVRRIGIAQALLGRPDILLLDEPTAGLDPEERGNFSRIISQVQGQTAVLLSTHLVEDVKNLCQEVILLREGRIRKMGTTEQIAAAAQGRVFEIPERKAQELGGMVCIEHCFSRSGEQMARVLLLGRREILGEGAEPCVPDLRDGYLYLLQEA